LLSGLKTANATTTTMYIMSGNKIFSHPSQMNFLLTIYAKRIFYSRQFNRINTLQLAASIGCSKYFANTNDIIFFSQLYTDLDYISFGIALVSRNLSEKIKRGTV
jgi:hypothetical protein